MIGVPDGVMCGKHSYSTSPMSSAHSRDRHREGSFRRSPGVSVFSVLWSDFLMILS